MPNAVVLTDLPSDPTDIPLIGTPRTGGSLTFGTVPNRREGMFAKPHPFRVGASLGGGVGLPTYRAYTEWLGRNDVIAMDYCAKANWFDIEAPAFIFQAWAPWQAAYPDNWLALTVHLLPDTLPSSVAQNWTDGANGVHDAHWNTLGDNIVASGLKNLIIRLSHEFNLLPIPGGSLNNWQTYWRRVVNILRAKFTAASGVTMMTVWNPTVNNTAFDLDAMWPGAIQRATVAPADFGGISNASGGSPASTNLRDRIMRAYPFVRRMPTPEVDFIGVDIYDQSASGYVNGVTPTNATRHEAWWSFLSNFDEFPNNAVNTSSLNYFTRLSQETGIPLCVPEWGLWEVGQGRPAGGDNPIFIRKMYEWMKASNVAWASYFDFSNVGLDAHHQLWPGLNNTFSTVFPRGRDEFLRLF